MQIRDLIFGDNDGVVVVPSNIINDVTKKALEKVNSENTVRDEINEGPKIKKGDIKKGKFVWFEDGKNSAVKVKVKNIVPSKDGKEEHYVTNKGTFTPSDVVGY